LHGLIFGLSVLPWQDRPSNPFGHLYRFIVALLPQHPHISAEAVVALALIAYTRTLSLLRDWPSELLQHLHAEHAARFTLPSHLRLVDITSSASPTLLAAHPLPSGEPGSLHGLPVTARPWPAFRLFGAGV
jgi:hypothetical protein